ncbi:hypothetical protein [Paraflavitalea sp. CAU 1676]|uniref:hypothetical protein n=1 Tax=Paraflavitalea sp. CAU 1676 TaxID=3032598 RepID=UPI0023DA06B5|nr:hypothetical protein [Paraflavitalea sp. CAU 1676]MDF2187174.1 hypothetical protein [Paraflavitalea sp. CAU 1676]
MYRTSHHTIRLAVSFFAALLFLNGSGALAQDFSTVIQNQFNNYRKNTLPEKTYVHTDKGFYLAGEILWFKVYYVNGNNNKPVDLSKIAYVELLDKEHKPVMQAKVALANGQGSGSFYLPSSVNAGNYILRAYTNWMKNFGPDCFYEQQVTIVNSLKPLPAAPVDTTISYTARFFPEGGNLVKGINSKVAFQVTDQFGKGCAFTGTLINQRNETILTFKPVKFGIGHFSFTPAAGDSYSATIVTEDGKSFTSALPATYDQGYVMHVEDEANGQLVVTINSNMPARPSGSEELFLFVHSHEVVKSAMKKAIQNGSVRFTIDKQQLGEGVSQITVFNDQKQPVCERLYFKPLKDQLTIGAAGYKEQYGTRKEINLSVQTAITSGKAAPSHLSLSVYRMDSLPSPEQEDIQSYLWLSSDLKGHIESPGYYFSAQTPEVFTALDNLMLVHGWRRFNWDVVLNSNAPAFKYTPEFAGHQITGRLTHLLTGQPVANAKTYLSIAGTKLQFYPVMSNSNGDVRFDVRNYYGPGEIIIQAEDQPDSSFHVDIQSPYADKFSETGTAPFYLSPALQQVLTEGSINMQVQNAYFSDRLTQFSLPKYDTMPFFGNGYPKYLMDDYVRFTTTEEILREYVPDVAVRKSNGEFQLYIFNWEIERHYRGSPLVLLDGVPVSIQKVMTYDPLKLRQLQVVTDRYVTGEFTYDGIVSFTTYHGDLTELKLDNKAVILDYDGLQLQREFYAPEYDSQEKAQSRLPDFRNLLYWTPDIETDANGKAAVRFYSSDLKGRFAVVVQGIDSNGHAGSHAFSFEVR